MLCSTRTRRIYSVLWYMYLYVYTCLRRALQMEEALSLTSLTMYITRKNGKYASAVRSTKNVFLIKTQLCKLRVILPSIASVAFEKMVDVIFEFYIP